MASWTTADFGIKLPCCSSSKFRIFTGGHSGTIKKADMCQKGVVRAANRAETRGDMINLFILKRSSSKMINLVTKRKQQDYEQGHCNLLWQSHRLYDGPFLQPYPRDGTKPNQGVLENADCHGRENFYA